MKKKVGGLGVLLLIFCGGISMAADPMSTNQNCFEFNTGKNTITRYKFEDSNCPKNVVIPESIEVNGANYEVRELGKNSFSHSAFSGYLESVIMPSTLKKVGENAYLGQYNLHTVRFNDGLEEIGTGAFYVGIYKGSIYDCPASDIVRGKLTSILFPTSLKILSARSFSCQSLTSVTIPEGITKVGQCTFCSNNLNAIMLPNSLQEIGEIAFWKNKLETVNFSSGLTTIGVKAFQNNKLHTVVIPDSVTSIGEKAFHINPGIALLGLYDYKTWTGLAYVEVKASPLSPLSSSDFENAYLRSRFYTINFLSEGTDYAIQTGFYGESINPVSTPTKTGFTFSGWNPSLPEKITADQTFKAEWTPIVYTITLDLDGGTGTANLTGFYNDSLTVSTPTKTGFAFSGWNPALSATITADQTFKAQWKANAYTLTFDLDGGTGTASLTGAYNELVPQVKDPTRPRYRFLGWEVPLPEKFTQDMRIKALWKKRPSSSSGGGSSTPTDNCPNGDRSGSPTDGRCDAGTTTGVVTPGTVMTGTIATGIVSTGTQETIITGDQPDTGLVKFSDDLLYNPTILNGQCYTRRPYLGIKDSVTIMTSEEFKKALSFLWSYEMTRFDSVEGFASKRNLTREEAAKIFSQFAMNVLCRKPDLNLHTHYSDTVNANSTLKPYIELAYQLGIMKGSGKGDGEFRPFDAISKAEVNAVLIRMILKSYLDESKIEGRKWYTAYNQVATTLGIITKDAGREALSREYLALMLFRAYKNQVFEWRNIDYFSYVLEKRDSFVK